MNMILYNKVKRDLKNVREEKLKKIVIKMQKQFGITDKSNALEIEQRIDDNNYSKITKKQKFNYNNIVKKFYHQIRNKIIHWWMSEDC